MGKYYFKACKVHKEPGKRGTPASQSWPSRAAAGLPVGRTIVPLGSRVPAPGEKLLHLAGPICWASKAGTDTEVGGAGRRKCPLHLKIVWEGTGNRNFGPAWKCFLNYQEIRIKSCGGRHHPVANLLFPVSTLHGRKWRKPDLGLGGERGQTGKALGSVFCCISNTAYLYHFDR